MHVSTQHSSETVLASEKEQFLIVPIFFKKQIEALVRAKAPASAFGFFYGEQRENYRIIKKIWPVPHSENEARKVSISATDFEQAKSLQIGDSMRLLGCFYSSGKGPVKRALLSSQEMDSFSFVELCESDNETCSWTSSICERSHEMHAEKVIL